jgi:DNA-binding NtrC family response regulator
MSCHVLLFEQGNSPPELDVGRIVAGKEGFTCERRVIDSAIKFEAQKTPACAAMAVALSNTTDIVPFLKRVQSLCKEQVLIAVLPGNIDAQLLESVDDIVDDFVLWPAHSGELGIRILRLLEGRGSDTQAVSERLIQALGFAQFVGQHPAFLKVVEKMPLIAKSGAPVVITGQTGTGKELCARVIHHLSARRDYPFIPVDCGILPEHLVENELFGHAKGAFTDAHADQQGLIALANKGTLFLDEVDALPLTTQAKLLRFLQERTFKPLGSERFVHVDINVIAATNRDLESCVVNKEFRSDLYYRLNVFRLKLPTLRERASDIGLLAGHFLSNMGEEGQRKVLTPRALRKLELYDWPGNVRELFNVIQQAVAYSANSRITAEDILLPGAQDGGDGGAQSFREIKARTVEAFERSFIEELLRKNSGNVSRAAREAQKDRRTFGRLIKKYKIERKRA